MAAALRTPGTGEELVEGMTRETFGGLMGAVSPAMEQAAIDDYWRSLGTAAGRQAVLEMYRSGDFEKLAPYEGALARLGLPTLIIWGENDEFSPVAGAHRFHGEIPGSQLEVVADAGVFVFADAPEGGVGAVLGFVVSL
jgi:haloalkane dehalogenase